MGRALCLGLVQVAGRRNLFEVETDDAGISQGSDAKQRSVATLGWRTESLWDSASGAVGRVRDRQRENVSPDGRLFNHAPARWFVQNACDRRFNCGDETPGCVGRGFLKIIISGFSVFQERVRMEAIGHRPRARAASTNPRTRRMASSPGTGDTSSFSICKIRRRTSASWLAWKAGGTRKRSSANRSANSSRSGAESCSTSSRMRARVSLIATEYHPRYALQAQAANHFGR